MGMFQAQNYGNDFMQGMQGMAGIINDRRRMDLDESRQASEAKTREMQQQGLALDNEKKQQELVNDKNLRSFIDLSGRLDAGALQPEDYSKLTKVTGDILEAAPYLPSDPKQIPQYKQYIDTVVKGVESVRNLPPGDYRYSRDDNIPEVNSVLDGFGKLLSKDRHAEHTDTDGSVTGTPGGVYRTADVGGFFMRSGEGSQAHLTPLFSVTDANGRPIVDQATGKIKLVPATVNRTNSPDDPISAQPADQLLAKAGFAYKVLDTAERLGLSDPARRDQIITNGLLANVGEKGVDQWLARHDRTPKTQVVAEGGMLVDQTGKVLAENPKTEKDMTAPAQHSFKKDGYEVTERWDPVKKQYVEIGRNKIKEPADPGAAETKRAEAQSKAAIDKASDEIKNARGRVAAAKKALDPLNPEADDTDVRAAEQELADAKTAYLNRTAEHKASYGREYNPIKEVVERQPERSIAPLKARLADKGKVWDYPAFIKSAETNGWTSDEIRRAAKGTPGEKSVSEYYATAAAKPAPGGMIKTASVKPAATAGATAQTSIQNGRIVVTGFK